MELFFNDGNRHLGADSRPYVSLHDVLARTPKKLDAQGLLDPFEKRLDLLVVFVKSCDGGSSQIGIVNQED